MPSTNLLQLARETGAQHPDRLVSRLRRIEVAAADRGEPCTVHVQRLGRIESYSGADWYQAAARAAVADVRRDCPGIDDEGTVNQCSIADAWIGPYGPRGVMTIVRALSTRARARYHRAVELAAVEPPRPRRRPGELLRALAGVGALPLRQLGSRALPRHGSPQEQA